MFVDVGKTALKSCYSLRITIVFCHLISQFCFLLRLFSAVMSEICNYAWFPAEQSGDESGLERR